MASGEILSRRALNRATLARQLLIERHAMSTVDAVHSLVGLNAQMSLDPYIGLWTRLIDFQPDQLADCLHDRSIVRSCLMRYTQHVVTAADFHLLRPLVTPILARVQRSAFGRGTQGIDLAELVDLGTALLRDTTLTRPQLGKKLRERWPDKDASALAWSFQYLAPVIHPPPDGLWGRKGGHTPFVLAEDWLGASPTTPAVGDLVLRYLSAFGPASLRDIHAWSGLSKLGDIVDALRPQLMTFRDDSGVELFDVPDGPRPDPETPIPIRFLPEYDNVIVGFYNRHRMMTKEQQSRVCVGAYIASTLLVDGFVQGMWRIHRSLDTATLAIELFAPLKKSQQKLVHAEGMRLVQFVTPEVDRHIIRMA